MSWGEYVGAAVIVVFLLCGLALLAIHYGYEER
jgi:hypothetical protein